MSLVEDCVGLTGNLTLLIPTILVVSVIGYLVVRILVLVQASKN